MQQMKGYRVAFCLGAIILTATVLRLALGFVYFGFHTGDDVEILQAGFMRALGWPYQPCEIRNLLVSDLLTTPSIALASALGVSSTQTLIWLASVPMVLLASFNIWLVYRLAVRWLRSEQVALLASALYGFHWLPLGYGSMVYPRTVSTTCVLAAAWVLWERRGGPIWRPILAGALMAFAWAIRYSEAIFLLPLFTLIGLEEKDLKVRLIRSGALAAGFLLVSFLTVGLEDWLTWGRPFASLAAFARYTLLEHKSSSLEPAQPWYWYLWRLPKWLAPTFLPFLWRARKTPGALRIALLILLPILELSVIHQKQLRYLQGVVPFLILLVAAGAWNLWRSGWRRSVAVLVLLSFLFGLSGLTFLAQKSMAAVLVAQKLAGLPTSPAMVCLSQAWAYGSTMYLGNRVGIRDLPAPLTGPALAGVLGSCPLVAIYREDYRRDVRIPALLTQYGFTATGEYRWAKSKPVILFRRGAPLQAPGTFSRHLAPLRRPQTRP